MPTAYNATRHGMRPAYNSLKIRGIAKGGLSQCKRPPFSVQYMAFRDAIGRLLQYGTHHIKKSAPHLRRAPTFYLNNTKLETLLFLCVSVRHTNHLYAGFWKASLSASVISIASSWPFGIGRR